MCRLLGVLADKPIDMEFSMGTAPNSFVGFGDGRNPDGWGMGWYESGIDTPRIFKEPLAAMESEELPHLVAGTVSRIFACHVRKSTCGNPSIANTHPFRHENWLFAHNGAVDRGVLLDRLNREHRDAVQGDTDSETYFHWILQNIEEQAGDVASGVRRAVAALDKYTGLNFILSDGERLYAYRDASRRRNHYSLFFLKRNPFGEDTSSPDRIESCQTDAIIHSARLRDERAVMICSEKLTGDDVWQEIPLGSLLTVNRDLGTELTELNAPRLRP